PPVRQRPATGCEFRLWFRRNAVMAVVQEPQTSSDVHPERFGRSMEDRALVTVQSAAAGSLYCDSIHLKSVPYAPAKRCLDIALSGMGMILLSPLFALTALLVRLTSPGPVLFKQTRVREG